jgi:hypothetical protein
MAIKVNLNMALEKIFELRIMALAKIDYRGAYEELYTHVDGYSNSAISRIERNLVKNELAKTGSDKIHWEVWEEFKYEVNVQNATGDIPYGEVVE